MLKNSLQAPFLVMAAFKWKPLTNFTFDTSGDTKRARDALGERMGGCLFITNFWFYLNLSFGPWRRFVFKLKYWANLFKYIFLFYSFVYFFIALPFHIFLHVVIVLIQVYSWEIRHTHWFVAVDLLIFYIFWSRFIGRLEPSGQTSPFVRRIPLLIGTIQPDVYS